MNPILENLYHDKTILPKRQAIGLASLDPSVDPFTRYLHEEMRACFLNGHDHAALVMACALVDFSLKDAIHFEQYVKADYVFSPDEWDKIDALESGRAINLAKSRGIISKDEAKGLESIREHIRNVYMHGQTPHWIKDKDDAILEANLESGEVVEKNVKARENIMLQRIARIAADRNICDQIVRFVDGMIRTLLSRANDTAAEWKRRNPQSFSPAQIECVMRKMQEKGLSAGLAITNEWPQNADKPQQIG